MDEEIQDQKNKLFVTESVQQRVRSAQLLKSRNGADNVGLDGMDPPEGERNEYDDEVCYIFDIPFLALQYIPSMCNR